MSIWPWKRRSAKAHFVSDYESYVRRLLRTHRREEAMSLAVGGDYDRMGQLQADLLIAAGLRPASTLIDIGCGSGRLAKALGQRFPDLSYTGTDVVAALVAYAREQAPPNYRFAVLDQLTIPANSRSVDMVCAFSVFTHLFHEETFRYLVEVRRVLRSGGSLIFSFLESGRHWTTFARMIEADWGTAKPHLNMFIERSAIEVWAAKLGLTIEGYDLPPDIGQSTVLLRNP